MKTKKKSKKAKLESKKFRKMRKEVVKGQKKLKKFLDKSPCSFGSGNPDMLHYNVQYICTRAGYTSFNCELHKCVGMGSCCRPIIGPEHFQKTFKPLCYKCEDTEKLASLYCPTDDSYVCGKHREKTGSMFVSIDDRKQSLIRILFRGKGPVKKEAKIAKKKVKLKNKHGDGCPVRRKLGPRSKKTQACGNYASYLCSKRKMFVCYIDAHESSEGSMESCCEYTTFDQAKAMGGTHSGQGSVSSDFESGGSFDGMGSSFRGSRERGELSYSEGEEQATEPIENPCMTCGQEGTYWCKKYSKRRCATHSHMRWDCCEFMSDSEEDSGKKALKEVQFVEA